MICHDGRHTRWYSDSTPQRAALLLRWWMLLRVAMLPGADVIKDMLRALMSALWLRSASFIFDCCALCCQRAMRYADASASAILLSPRMRLARERYWCRLRFDCAIAPLHYYATYASVTAFVATRHCCHTCCRQRALIRYSRCWCFTCLMSAFFTFRHIVAAMKGAFITIIVIDISFAPFSRCRLRYARSYWCCFMRAILRARCAGYCYAAKRRATLDKDALSDSGWAMSCWLRQLRALMIRRRALREARWVRC